jgi:hypothetical protein
MVRQKLGLYYFCRLSISQSEIIAAIPTIFHEFSAKNMLLGWHGFCCP